MSDFDHLEDLAEIERELIELVCQTKKQTSSTDLVLRKLKDELERSKKSEGKFKRRRSFVDKSNSISQHQYLKLE
jgi:hypothetical protein